jgi:hypothetical protein
MQHVCRTAQLSVRASSKLFTAVFHEESGAQMPDGSGLDLSGSYRIPAFPAAQAVFLNKKTPTSVSLQPNDHLPRTINARGLHPHQWRHYS